MKTLDIATMDLHTHEGRLLQAALIELTTTVHRDLTPYQVIDNLYLIAQRTDEANKIEKPWKDKGNIYWREEQLAKAILQNFSHEIKNEGAVEVAIRLLERLHQNETAKKVSH